ncbi:hypothetical protein D3C87_1695970 [compost metagenome]
MEQYDVVALDQGSFPRIGLELVGMGGRCVFGSGIFQAFFVVGRCCDISVREVKNILPFFSKFFVKRAVG